MMAVAMDTGFTFQSTHEITKIEFTSDCLEITSQSIDGAQIIRAVFFRSRRV